MRNNAKTLAVDLEKTTNLFIQGKLSYEECDKKVKEIWKEIFKLKIHHDVIYSLRELTEGDWNMIKYVLSDI